MKTPMVALAVQAVLVALAKVIALLLVMEL